MAYHEVYGSEHLGCARIGARIYDLKKKGNLYEKEWAEFIKDIDPTKTRY